MNILINNQSNSSKQIRYWTKSRKFKIKKQGKNKKFLIKANKMV